ncbi:MAG: VCBS repeat-containing protein [bacterium]|nr:VCBS repeat-containing protein [bacterium]
MKRTEWILVGCLVGAASVQAQVAAPVLKWQNGGCYSSWCETGWYSSPAAADLDGNGSVEVIASAYSIVSLNGATGALNWRVASGHDRNEPGADNVGRTWPGIVLADVDGDEALEIATSHGAGWASVYTADGYFESGWPQRPSISELRGLAAGDIDQDGSMEIVVSAAVGSKTNTWVFEHTGSLRAGWPQLVGESGYAYGVFNDNVALANLDSDDKLEVIVPSDVHYICAYNPNGSHVMADPVYGGKTWGLVGVWEDYAIELRGWGRCNGERDESYRTNFADGPATVADMDGDGELEVVATGRVYDCTGGETTKYTGVYIFQTDRGRFVTTEYDWTIVPTDLGLPLSLDWNVIEGANYNPAVADLDGDGEKEIIYADFAGNVHAFWLDRTEHDSWPLAVYEPSEGFYRLASEPVVADLDNDGTAEVLFTSWSQKHWNANGHLYVVGSTGTVLHKIMLPDALGSSHWDGALAAPTLVNIDDDADLEILVQTAHAGVVAYDLPGTDRARVLWGTGRGSYTRSGTTAVAPLVFSDGFESGSASRWSKTVP